MGLTEIILIIVGAVIMVTSFVLPAGRRENTENLMPKIDEKQIRDLIEKEIKGAKNHINDMVDETLTYSMEKTERAMERLTNEKIMAVSEYSEQVLGAINKNHQEVIFLYDMLNDKHENLVNTVSEASRKAQEIKQTVQDAEIVVKEAAEAQPEQSYDSGSTEDEVQCKTKDAEVPEAPGGGEVLTQIMNETEFVPIAPKKVEIIQEQAPETEEESVVGKIVEESVKNENDEDKTYNNNEKILRLHKLGMSQTAIAKELGLGVGEVKLVIDLFKQA